MASLLTASITYLVMLEDFCPVYNGILLNENSGWEQINEGIEVFINKIFQMNTDFIQIASYASKAPSGHNTQPWKFHIADNTITVIPNFEVALPVVDGNNRELFISLGCAVENLSIAANHFGYTTQIVEYSIKGIILELTKNDLMVENPLFHQIEKRQTNRSVYNGNKVSNEMLQQLQSIQKEDAVQFYFAEIGTPFADTIIKYMLKGNEIQMNDAAFKNELLSWMRFNKKQITETQNGLSYLVFGNPPLPEIFARPIVRLFLKSNMQNKSDRKKSVLPHISLYIPRRIIPLKNGLI